MKHQNCNIDESTERFVAETGIKDADISDKRYCHYYERSCRCKATNCRLRILQPAKHFFGLGYEFELVLINVKYCSLVAQADTYKANSAESTPKMQNAVVPVLTKEPRTSIRMDSDVSGVTAFSRD